MDQRGGRDRYEAVALLGYVVVAVVLVAVPVVLQAGTACFEGEPDQPLLCSDTGTTALTLWLGVTAVALTAGLAWLMLVLRHGRGRASGGPALGGPWIVLGVVTLAHVIMVAVLR